MRLIIWALAFTNVCLLFVCWRLVTTIVWQRSKLDELVKAANRLTSMDDLQEESKR